MPIDSTALLGMSISAPFSFSPSYSMFIARRWSAVGLFWYDFAACCEGMRDLHFRLPEDDARLLLARRLRLARHRVLQRVRNHDVAHLDRLDRDAPWIGARVDQLLQLRFDLLAAAQQLGRAPSVR